MNHKEEIEMHSGIAASAIVRGADLERAVIALIEARGTRSYNSITALKDDRGYFAVNITKGNVTIEQGVNNG